MELKSKKASESKKVSESKVEKEWEDISNPSAPSDERDKEQLLRQYKEAKRRNDNLIENEEVK